MTDTQHAALTGESLAFRGAVLRAWNKSHEGIFPDFRQSKIRLGKPLVGCHCTYGLDIKG